jgi:hypothetical protein
MMTGKQITGKNGERGNALFLILIAVALFAALSYAITQSGRGSGTVNKETNIVVSGQVVEEPAAVRTAVTRMIITGTSPTAITFTGAATVNDVFDSATGGGGATNVAPPSSACGTAADCAAWYYVAATSGNGTFVQGVGTTASEALAVLGKVGGGMTSSICTQIQKGLGFASTTPVVQATAVVWQTAGAYAAAAGGSATTVAGATTELVGQAFACFQNGTGANYTYYHTLIEQ